MVVRLRFELARTGRLFLVVRGPVPSCRVVATILVRGHAGANTVDFRGRAGRRQLDPGTYALSLSPLRRPPANAAATLVRVVSPTRTVPVEGGAPTCLAARSSPEAPRYQPLGERLIVATGQTAVPRRSSRAEPAAVSPVKGDEQHDVLGIVIPAPFDGDGPSGALGTLFSIGILTLIGMLLLAMATLVTRFVRGTWNP